MRSSVADGKIDIHSVKSDLAKIHSSVNDLNVYLFELEKKIQDKKVNFISSRQATVRVEKEKKLTSDIGRRNAKFNARPFITSNDNRIPSLHL